MTRTRGRVLGGLLGAAALAAAGVAAWRAAAPPAPAAPAVADEATVEQVRRDAGSADALLAALAAPASTPAERQARAMALSALARHAGDPRARAALLDALGASGPREERLLALAVLSGLRGPAWAVPALERLTDDPDPQVRDGARSALGRAAPPARDTP